MNRFASKKLSVLAELLKFSDNSLLDRNSDKLMHYIGLGGAGCNALEYIHKKGVKAKYTCITNPERPHLPSDIDLIQFTSPRHYLYKNISDMDQKIVIPKEIKDVFIKDYQYILLAGLGGYTGTFMTEELTLWLANNKIKFLTVCSLPFSFESNREYADKTKEKLHPVPNFKYFDLEMMREKYGNLSLKQVFEKAYEQFYFICKNYL